MPRYIDAEMIEPSEIIIPCGDGKYEYAEVVYMDDFREIPTADVVEVVRCKDCKFYEFWERKGIYLCERWAGDPYEAAEPGDDDFCSFAERRDDATD